MNANQIGGVVRALLAYAFGALGLSGGWVEVTIAIGGIIAVGVWSVYSNKITTMIGEIAKSDDVHEVVTTRKIAMDVPSNKVVSSSTRRL